MHEVTCIPDALTAAMMEGQLSWEAGGMFMVLATLAQDISPVTEFAIKAANRRIFTADLWRLLDELVAAGWIRFQTDGWVVEDCWRCPHDHRSPATR
ncbi:hypothetical protein [Streptomyces sp. NPDC051561]|uniref:hypothetical protein n=1 Tax=Streptomyces sp. NPDC051561 TaxID=3365658 RepID=UPI003792BE6A